MKERKQPFYGILLITSILFTLAAISTIIPQASASKVCFLGYKAHCSFTPIGTLICLAGAGVSCAIRKHLFTRNIAKA